jgi:hypothetical protein
MKEMRHRSLRVRYALAALGSVGAEDRSPDPGLGVLLTITPHLDHLLRERRKPEHRAGHGEGRQPRTSRANVSASASEPAPTTANAGILGQP